MVTIFSCSKEEKNPIVPYINKEIIIDYSSPDVKTKASDSDAFESYISHLDIFIFKLSDDADRIVWHERVSVTSSQGSHTLNVGTGYFAQKDAYGNIVSHPKYDVHILANCTLDMSFSEQQKTLTIEGIGTYTSSGEIGSVVYQTPDIHLSGLNLDSVPNSFLMHSCSKSIALSTDDSTQGIVIDARLERAAAKVLINIREGMNVEFTEGGDLLRKGLFDTSEKGLYYIRNLPYQTSLFPSSTVLRLESDELRTTTKTNNAHFTWDPTSFSTDTTSIKETLDGRDVVSITAYAYPHNWKDAGVFEYEPCAVVNLPLIFVEEHDGHFGYHAHANSWYKIPLTNGSSFERNNLYKVNVEINYAGATTIMEPVVVPDIKYEVLNYKESNTGWNTHEVNISQSHRPKYLTISETEIDIHNDDYTDIVLFTSSADVSVSVDEVYYYNNLGVKTSLAKNTVNVSATSGLSGKIVVESPVPQDNRMRYIKVRVSNGEATDRTFLIRQYPLEYITSVQGYYSYREDFGGTTYESYGGKGYVSATWDNNKKTWTLSTKGENSSTLFFSSKVATKKNDGSSTISYYNWNNRNKVTTTNISGLTNARMYHVRLTSSSNEYSIGVPKLDAKGWTDSGETNALLVSPSFMIASQLGATYEPTSIEQAASHCNQYVETYKDESGKVIHLNDWRLPTAAEINIIINFQYKDNAAMVEVLSGRYYWSASGKLENEKSSSAVDSKSAVRCIRNAF